MKIQLKRGGSKLSEATMNRKTNGIKAKKISLGNLAVKQCNN